MSHYIFRRTEYVRVSPSAIAKGGEATELSPQRHLELLVPAGKLGGRSELLLTR